MKDLVATRRTHKSQNKFRPLALAYNNLCTGDFVCWIDVRDEHSHKLTGRTFLCIMWGHVGTFSFRSVQQVNIVRNSPLWSLMDAGSWIQDPRRSWTFGPGFKIQRPGSRIQHPGFWTLDPGSCLKDYASRILHTGSKILDPMWNSSRCSILFQNIIQRVRNRLG